MDRYQPAPLGSSAAALGPRDMGASAAYSDQYYQAQGGSAYPSSNLPQGTLGYQTTTASYGQPDNRQTQSYSTGSYQSPAGMVYVPQAASAQNPTYDPSQYSRPPAGLPLMNSDVTPHYYQSGPAGVPPAASTMQPPAAPSSTSQTGGYQQPSALQGYANMAAMGGLTPQTSTAAEMAMEVEAIPVEEDPSETYGHYESTLREAFREIRDCDLVTASETLLTASSLLRDGVTRFGMFFFSFSPWCQCRLKLTFACYRRPRVGRLQGTTR